MVNTEKTQGEKITLLWEFMIKLFDEVEMERIDGGYSITIEIHEEENT